MYLKMSNSACLRVPHVSRQISSALSVLKHVSTNCPAVHDLAGLRDITQLLCQVQQTGFVFNDLVGSIQHRGFLVLWLECTTIKTSNHHLDQATRRSQFCSLKAGAVSDQVGTNQINDFLLEQPP